MNGGFFFTGYTAVKAITMLTITNASLVATVDMGTVLLHYKLPYAGTQGVNIQWQILFDNGTPNWPQINPAGVLGLVPNDDNTGTFTTPLATGKYTQARLLFFVAGTNYAQFLGELTLPCVFEVTTQQLRLTTPQMVVHTEKAASTGNGNTFYPYEIRLPAPWKPADLLAYSGDAYFWVMAKGSAGFTQQQMWFTDKVSWAPYVKTAAGPDPYLYIDTLYDLIAPLGFTLPTPSTAGIYNLNFGFFKSNWGQISWSWPPFELEVGGDAWETKCSATALPTLPVTLAKGAAPFAITGNYGNAIAFKPEPANNNPLFFKLLRALGILTLRFNYDPNQYLASAVYQHRVDQIVQNMWLANITPCIAPQWVPNGGAAELLALNQLVTTKYKGLPIWLDICNEPSPYPTWAAWKPVAQSIAVVMLAIDANAAIVCPLEGYSKDANAASADPLPDGLVKYYGWHPYLNASQLKAAAGPGNLKLWAQESRDGSTAFNAALQGLANVSGYGAWAWTTPGDDSIPLVLSVNGAMLNLDAVGQALIGYYATWNAGKLITDSVPVPPPVVNPPVTPVPPGSPPATGSGSTGLSLAEIDTEIQKVLNAVGFELAADVPPAMASALTAHWNAHQADLKTMMDAEIATGLSALTTQVQTLKSQQALLAAAELKLVGKTGGLTNADLQAAIAPLQAAIASLTTQVQADEAKMKPVLDLLAG